MNQNSRTPIGARRLRRQARRTRRRALGAGALLLVVAVTSAFAVPAASARDSGTTEDAGADVPATIADIQSFWATTMPSVYGTDYKPIPADRQIAYSEQNPPPACGGSGSTPYEDVAGNAFYCSEGDFIAWDEQGLFPKLRQEFGDFAVALVLAHEWGHAIQARTNSQLNATVYLELQADCFAGAWTHHADHGQDTSLRVEPGALDQALAGYLTLRDPLGTDGGQQGAHGNAFDRVSAFQDGYQGGASTCAEYESTPPSVTENGYTSSQDAANGGNLPTDELRPLLRTDLDTYWASEVKGFKPVAALTAASGARCANGSDGGVLDRSVTYCSATRTVTYDAGTLDAAADQIGDFGAGMLLVAAWSSAVLDQLHQPLGTDTARLSADCLSGAWTGSVARGDSGHKDLQLSPGDLDEAIRTFVVSGGRNAGDSAFARVDAFRTGFFDGADRCKDVGATQV